MSFKFPVKVGRYARRIDLDIPVEALAGIGIDNAEAAIDEKRIACVAEVPGGGLDRLELRLRFSVKPAPPAESEAPE